MIGQFPPYAAISVAAAVLSLILAWVSWKRRTIPGGTPLMLLMLALTVWSLADALEMVSVAIPARLLWAQVGYIGVASAPALFLSFALEYSRQGQRLTRRNLLALWIFPLITITIAFTNEWHGWLWTGLTPNPNDPRILIYELGPWSWITLLYSSLAVIAGVIVFFRAFSRFQAPYRRQAWLLSLAAAIPLVANVIHVTPWSPLVGLDLSPSAFTLSGLLLLVALSRFQLLDLVPVARDTLLEHLTDGVVVLDEQNRIMELNPAAQKLLRADPPLIGQRVEQVCAAITPNPTALETQSEIVLAKNPACFLEVRTSPLRDRRNHVTGRLVVLHDVTQRKKIETALQELNTDLESLIGARTAELEATVGALQNEIAERQRVETSLRRMEESLAERIAEQSRKLSALYEVMLFAGKSLTVPEMHAQALATIIGVINCQAGCIYQLEDNGRTLRLIAQRGLTPEMQAQIETLPADWFLSDAIPRTVIDLAAKVNIPATLRLPGLEAFLGVPTHLQDRPTGLLSVFWKHAHSLAVEDIALFHAMADQLGILEENARLREQSATTAVLQERRRLARDLHDSVTQSLHSLVLSADTTCALAQRRQLDVLDATAAQLAESARQALKEMRLMLFELRLAALDTMDLVEQLETRLDMVERRAGVDVQLVVDQTAYIPKEWTNDLCAIAMEALNNALKHAQATRVRVTLHAHLSAFRLEIADNGCGFDPQHPRAGMGLASMQERADRLGGSLAIESSPGNGTKVCVEIGDADS